MRVLGFHGREFQLMNLSITHELRSTMKEQDLFRSNSLYLRMMMFYTKSAGSEWLVSTLRPPLERYLLNPKPIEFDPKFNTEYVTVEESERNLTALADSVLDSIRGSLSSVPVSIRRMGRIVNHRVKAKFPGLERSALGTFLFLRIFCPAINAPELLELPDMDIKTRRPLVTLSKVLQRLTTGLPFGKKEPHLTAMNPFIESRKSRVDEYLGLVSKVPVAALGQKSGYPVSKELKEESLKFVYTVISENREKLEPAYSDLVPMTMTQMLNGEDPMKELDEAIANGEGVAPESRLAATSVVSDYTGSVVAGPGRTSTGSFSNVRPGDVEPLAKSPTTAEAPAPPAVPDAPAGDDEDGNGEAPAVPAPPSGEDVPLADADANAV